MSIDTSTTRKLAHLARIAITEEQCTKWTHDLNALFTHIQTLNELDTDLTDPLTHGCTKTQRLDEDTVRETNQRDHFQANAPKNDKNQPYTAAGLYLVPKVVD